jgi:hypothetical protein
VLATDSHSHQTLLQRDHNKKSSKAGWLLFSHLHRFLLFSTVTHTPGIPAWGDDFGRFLFSSRGVGEGVILTIESYQARWKLTGVPIRFHLKMLISRSDLRVSARVSMMQPYPPGKGARPCDSGTRTFVFRRPLRGQADLEIAARGGGSRVASRMRDATIVSSCGILRWPCDTAISSRRLGGVAGAN